MEELKKIKMKRSLERLVKQSEASLFPKTFPLLVDCSAREMWSNPPTVVSIFNCQASSEWRKRARDAKKIWVDIGRQIIEWDRVEQQAQHEIKSFYRSCQCAKFIEGKFMQIVPECMSPICDEN